MCPSARGKSRSATIVIAYLMRKHRISYEEAFARVRQRRKEISLNKGFVAQLRHWHKLDYDITRYDSKAFKPEQYDDY
jgi:dual specificity phosphatase 12